MKKEHALVEYGLILSLFVVFVIMALGKLSSSISSAADSQANIPPVAHSQKK